MGETTQESLPNILYLKGRINIVLTNKLKITKEVHFYDDDTIVYYASNINEVYEFIDEINNANTNNDDIYNNRYIDDNDVYIIGGGQTYKYFLENDLIQAVYLTRMYHTFHGDTFIPDITEYGFTKEVVVTPLTQSDSGYYYSIFIYRKRFN
jgi:dihydrofolate reductase